MKTTTRTMTDERGYVLVAALVTLLLLTVLGIWATRTSTMELRMAANERVHQETFYHADAATQLAERLIHHDWRCFNSSTQNVPPNKMAIKTSRLPGSLHFKDDMALRMAVAVPMGAGQTVTYTDEEGKQTEITYDESEPSKHEPSDDYYTFRYCLEKSASAECAKLKQKSGGVGYTNVLVGAEKKEKPGTGALQSSAYDGESVGSGNMVIYYKYVIKTQHIGPTGGESRVSTSWQWSDTNISLAQEKEDCFY